MRTYIVVLFIFLSLPGAKAQPQESLFEDSYALLKGMLEAPETYSFKKGVLSIENAYLNGRLDTAFVNREIRIMANLAKSLIRDRFLAYVENDKEDVNKWASVYQVMKDTIPVVIEDRLYDYLPMEYDFSDVFGHEKHTNMFVSKLLYTRRGNCHSLPYLYKILCEELGTNAHLALAPNHIYIKHQNKKHGWYNTELTSGIFPNDAWLMASGFIHLDAITNGVYMKALNHKESVALLIMDLATAYEKIYPESDGVFLMKCAETALKAYPNFVAALILRAEMHKKQLEQETNEKKAEALFTALEKEYTYIHELGYRYMPEDMYLHWLVSLAREKDKYENKKLYYIGKN